MDLQKTLELLLTISKSKLTLITLLGIAFLAIAILGKFKDWIELKTRNERIIAGLLGAVLIIIGITFEPPPPPGPPTTPSSTIAPNEIRIRISGSTTMAQYTERYKQGFEKEYPGAKVEFITEGTNIGIMDIYSGKADIAAVSRDLEDSEEEELAAKYVGPDDIAVVVGKDNPWTGGLTMQQLSDIFQGKYKNWSEVGGVSKERIIVWNRPMISGTRQVFQKIVLKGQKFGRTDNIKQLEEDGTTFWIHYLKTNGIGYGSCIQICKQLMIRNVSIDSHLPGQGNYPIVRKLYYVYKKKSTNPGIELFINYVAPSTD